ncbi:MAG TPA: TetR family transcriptional regulator [Polyangiaceae bacterium]|nr:TetR family transcriptional regulator [Polyangiaceae bacterium]
MSGQKQLKTTREQVVAAALRVADETGIEGLTIRAVASEARTPPMSLYSHFGKKEDLLDLMYEQICQQIYPGPEHETWQAALTRFCHNLREVLLAHPAWVPLLSRPAPVLALPGRERILQLMTRDGLPAEQSMSMLSSAGMFGLGLVMVELSCRNGDVVSGLAKRYENLRASSDDADFAAKNPITRLALKQAPTLDLSENYRIMVDAFVAGLDLRARSA